MLTEFSLSIAITKANWISTSVYAEFAFSFGCLLCRFCSATCSVRVSIFAISFRTSDFKSSLATACSPPAAVTDSRLHSTEDGIRAPITRGGFCKDGCPCWFTSRAAVDDGPLSDDVEDSCDDLDLSAYSPMLSYAQMATTNGECVIFKRTIRALRNWSVAINNRRGRRNNGMRFCSCVRFHIVLRFTL